MNELEVHAHVVEEFEFNGETLEIPIHYAGSIDRVKFLKKKEA